MEISLTPDQEAFLRRALKSGRITQPEDAAYEAMALWEERERRRAETIGRFETPEPSPVSRGHWQDRRRLAR